MSAVLVVVGFVLAAGPQGAPDVEALRPGDYAGWAFLQSGGDFPVRWRCSEERGERVVTVSLPHQRSYDLAAEWGTAPGGETTLALKSRDGSGLSFIGLPLREEVHGTLRLAGQEAGTFELVRAEVLLPTVRPETYADAAGLYRSSEGGALLFSAWPWGELRCLDLTNGEDRTLFAVGDDAFIAGPSCGVPGPTQSRFQLFRGSDGRVEGLERSAGRDASREYERLALRSEELDFQSGTATLRGTLLRPDTGAKLPAILLLGGSDVSLRQDVQATAQIYASFGFAVLAYDLRGHGQSSGERDCTLNQSADDACAALEMLGGRADIDPQHLGIAGTSRGGWTAPLAASRCGKVSFLVLFVAPAVSPARQLTSCWLGAFLAAGHGEQEASEAAAYIDLVWRCTESESDWTRYEQARKTMKERGWLALLGGPESCDSEEYHWQRLNAKYDPLPALERTTCPVLALYGEHDLVVRAAENSPLMEAALRHAGNRDATIQVVPGVDHGLWRVDPTRPSRPFPIHRALGFGPEVWSTVQRWLGERCHG